MEAIQISKDRIELSRIIGVIAKTNLSIEEMKKGPTSVILENEQFLIFVKEDKIIVKEVKKLFAKKYIYSLSELS